MRPSYCTIKFLCIRLLKIMALLISIQPSISHHVKCTSQHSNDMKYNVARHCSFFAQAFRIGHNTPRNKGCRGFVFFPFSSSSPLSIWSQTSESTFRLVPRNVPREGLFIQLSTNFSLLASHYQWKTGSSFLSKSGPHFKSVFKPFLALHLGSGSGQADDGFKPTVHHFAVRTIIYLLSDSS